MADTITTTRDLKLLAGFADEDDRTLTLPNPRNGISKSDIEDLAELATPVLIGDKYGATFTRFKEAKIVTATVVKMEPPWS